ncbi:hypothetical protein FRB96_005250 [Tulasnella sp. 330]|nr:hypothetical protein FRB96_005250 [Tulasnella sp. 330]
MQEIYKLVQEVSARKSECKALAGYANSVIEIIEKCHNTVPQSQMALAVSSVERIISELRRDLEQWKNYSRGTAFVRNSEIKDRLEYHRSSLDTVLSTVGFTQALEQGQWFQRIIEARSEDQRLLESLNENQIQLNKKMDELKQRLVPQSRKSYDSEAEGTRATVIQQLSRLWSDGPDAAYLTSSDLIYEVQKTGERLFHSGPMYEHWKGIWLDKHLVVLKVFCGRDPNEKPTEEARARINRQVDLWRSFKHPNVLELCGIFHMREGGRDDASVCFVSPWMPNRDIMRYIKTCPTADRLALIHDIAKGVQYLHSIGIMHDSLQGSNVLVDDAGHAVVSDFSLSKAMDPDALMSQTRSQSALRWWAPETQTHQILSVHTDVYSWGMTVLEIISGVQPYHTIKSIGKLVNMIIQSVTPRREDYEMSVLLRDDQLWDWLESCWVGDPEKRPPMDLIIEKLKIIRFGFAKKSSDGFQTLPTISFPEPTSPHAEFPSDDTSLSQGQHPLPPMLTTCASPSLSFPSIPATDEPVREAVCTPGTPERSFPKKCVIQ